MKYSREQIAAALDYAVLKPTATLEEIKQACILASWEQFASVCVRPCDFMQVSLGHLSLRSLVSHMEPTRLKPRGLRLSKQLERVRLNLIL
jgi:hypothetical protein